MTRREVAEFFRVSQMTVKRWEADRLPGYKIAAHVVRYKRADVMKLIQLATPAEAE